MSRPKTTPIERAVATVRDLPKKRLAMLAGDVDGLQKQYLHLAKDQRRAARVAKGEDLVRLVKAAQGGEDAARDVGKLLALLNAIGGAS